MMQTKGTRITGPQRTNTSILLTCVSEQESLIKALRSQKYGILLVQKDKWVNRTVWTMERRLAEIQDTTINEAQRRPLVIVV